MPEEILIASPEIDVLKYWYVQTIGRTRKDRRSTELEGLYIFLIHFLVAKRIGYIFKNKLGSTNVKHYCLPGYLSAYNKICNE